MTLFNYALSSLGAVASGNANGGTTVGQMIDGSDVTRCIYANVAGDQKVDLGAPQYITQVRFIGNNSNGPKLYYCDDGTNWLLFGNLSNFTSGLTVATGGVTARHWRITTLSNSNNYLYTFAVEGPVEVPPPPVAAITDPIEAWLDGIEQYMVPAVRDWLDAQ